MDRAPQISAPEAAPFRRPPGQVMRLDRMGSAHPTRLSFLHRLLRRICRDGWTFDRPLWDIDAQGVGRAVYRAPGAGTDLLPCRLRA